MIRIFTRIRTYVEINEKLFINFSMKIVYSLFPSIEISFFFRSYTFSGIIFLFMSLSDSLSFFLSLSFSPANYFTFRTIYFILGKCCHQTQRRNAAFYGYAWNARAGYDYSRLTFERRI